MCIFIHPIMLFILKWKKNNNKKPQIVAYLGGRLPVHAFLYLGVFSYHLIEVVALLADTQQLPQEFCCTDNK